MNIVSILRAFHHLLIQTNQINFHKIKMWNNVLVTIYSSIMNHLFVFDWWKKLFLNIFLWWVGNFRFDSLFNLQLSVLGKFSVFKIFPPIDNSPLQSHFLFQRIHRLFWCIQNEFSRCFLLIHNYRCLRLLVMICKISWICCIIGFYGVVSRMITGVSIFLLSTTITSISH